MLSKNYWVCFQADTSQEKLEISSKNGCREQQAGF